MAKKKDKKSVDYNQGIEELNIGDTCREYMQIFGANNNLMRHLPCIFDGLKIGERRILYTMYTMKLSYKSPFTKSASIVGATLDYHPHGDTSIYETLVKLAQSWNNTECTIEGHGNFGDISGASAAASRYTEARLTYYAYKCFFEEFSENIVDMKSNYLGNKLEPEYLPSKYPNVMINNSFGIGWGLSTSICTYNFKEVLEATIDLIENPDIENIVLYPDSPTGSYIIDEGQFEEISKTGRGRFKMRGVIEIDEENNILHIKSTPLQVSWQTIMKSVFEILNNNKVSLMRNFKDETDIDAMHYKIYLKKEVDPYATVQEIYSKTQMEKTFPVNFKLIEDYADNDYNIKSLLQTWIDFRVEVKRRYYNTKLVKNTERQHILEILLFILNADNAEKTMTIIKKSENKPEIVKKLIKAYGITSLQADTIAEMKLTAFSKESYKRYVAEKEKIDKEIKSLEKIVRSSKKINKIIIDELKEGIELFGTERKSKIINIDNEVKIRDTEHVIVFTKNGLIKKLPSDVTNIGLIGKNDYPIEVINARNTSELLIFDASGKISKLPVHTVPGTTLTNEGVQLNHYIKPTGGNITAVKVKPTNEILEKLKSPVYFLMLTRNGIIKKTEAMAYDKIKNEMLGIIIKETDCLVSVKLLVGDKDIVVYTKNGSGVRFNTSEIKETSRMSIGVKSINITDDDEIVGMEIINKADKYLLPITSKGFGKKCTLNNFKIMSRADKPLKIIPLEESDSIFNILTVQGNETFNIYTKENIQEMDIEDVPELTRLSKGKKLIPLKKGNYLLRMVQK